MKCIIVDDEPLAIDLLEDFISKVPYISLAGKCKNAIEAAQMLNQHEADLLFLDIHMPNINGIQLLQSIGQKPMVIFTTAYSEYAIESYNFNAVDYLLKPFTFERFFKAANKAYTLYNNKQQQVENTPPLLVPEKGPANKEYIFVKSDYKNVKVKIDDILYIEGLKDYIKIYAGGKPVLTLMSLKLIEEKLPKSQFIRAHKSFIVSLSKLDCIERGIIRIGQARIPIGESYKDEFQKVVKGLGL